MDSPGLFTGIQYMNKKTKSMTQNPLAPLAQPLNQVVSALTSSSGKQRKRNTNTKKYKPKVKRVTQSKGTGIPIAYSAPIGTSMQAANAPYKVPRKEYLFDVNASSSFAILSIAINPGLLTTFPWLSPTANSYEMYKFRRLRVCYQTRDNTTDKGTVCLAFDPNPNNPTPSTAQQVENFNTRLVCAPWADPSMSYFDIPPVDLNRKPKFMVRNSLVADDLVDYDLGQLYIATTGITSTGKVGEVWLDYEIDFYSPVPYQNQLSLPQPSSNSSYRQTASFSVPSTGAYTPIPWDTIRTNPLGLVPNAQGVFTGIRGSLVVYAQMTVTPAAQITGGGIAIQTSVDNGVTWVSDIFANWPQGVSATQGITGNVETVLQLLSTTLFRIALTSFGNAVTASPGNSTQTNILVLTPA